jgi:flagellar motor protein MotB
MSTFTPGFPRQNKLAKILGWATIIWAFLGACLVIYMGYLYFHYKLYQSSFSFTGGLSLVAGLFSYGVCKMVNYVVELIRQRNDTTSVITYRTIFLTMFASIATLVVCIVIMHKCMPDYLKEQSAISDKQQQLTKVDSKLFLADSTLHHYGTVSNTVEYAIVHDSISVKDMDATGYQAAKKNFRESIFNKADKNLLLAGCQKTGQVILALFGDNGRNKVILEELHRRRYFYYEEKIHATNNDCIISATLCLAKDPALDSTIQVIIRDRCIQWALYDKILNGPIPSKGLEVTLQQIVQAVCVECPKLNFVQLVMARCGERLDCDSVYFESGKYELSEVSRIVIERFYLEFLQKYPGQYYIDLYGFTDHRPIKDTIDYYGQGTYTNPFTLLPNAAIRDTLLEKITTNNQLSFARAASCYEFLHRMFPRQPNVFRYTGGGEGNFEGDDSRQRTVKIVINKK